MSTVNKVLKKLCDALERGEDAASVQLNLSVSNGKLVIDVGSKPECENKERHYVIKFSNQLYEHKHSCGREGEILDTHLLSEAYRYPKLDQAWRAVGCYEQMGKDCRVVSVITRKKR
jgi:hypothetical protein